MAENDVTHTSHDITSYSQPTTTQSNDVTLNQTSTSRTSHTSYDVTDADGRRHVAVRDLNESLTCLLCKGYLIDAHTVTNCLHSFCKACLVSYLRTNPACPACGLKASLGNKRDVRPDHVLQELVYAFVPSLFKDEMNKRRQFYRGYLQSDYGMSAGEEISVCLKLCTRCPPYDETAEDMVLDTRYLLCPAHFPVKFLDKFIRLKFNLDAIHKIDIYFKNEKLYEDYTLKDVAVVYDWDQNEAMTLNYVVEDTIKSLMNRIRASEKRRISASRTQSCDVTTTHNTQNTDTSTLDSSLENMDTSQNLDTSADSQASLKRSIMDTACTSVRVNITPMRINGTYRPSRPLTPKVKRKRGRPPKLKHGAAGIIAIQAKRQALKQVRARMTPTPTLPVSNAYTLPRSINLHSNQQSVAMQDNINHSNITSNQPDTDNLRQFKANSVYDTTVNVFQSNQNQTEYVQNHTAHQPNVQQTVVNESSHLDNSLQQRSLGVSNSSTSNMSSVDTKPNITGQPSINPALQQTIVYNQSSQNMQQPTDSHQINVLNNQNTFVTSQTHNPNNAQNVIMTSQTTPQMQLNAMHSNQPPIPNNVQAQNTITYTYNPINHQNTGVIHPGVVPSPVGVVQPGAVQPSQPVQYQHGTAPSGGIEEEPVTIPGLLPPKRRKKRGRPPRRQAFSPRLHHPHGGTIAGGIALSTMYGGATIKRKRGRPPKRKVGLPPVLVVSQPTMQTVQTQMVPQSQPFVAQKQPIMVAGQNQQTANLSQGQSQGQAISYVSQQPTVSMATVDMSQMQQAQETIAARHINQQNYDMTSQVSQHQLQQMVNNTQPMDTNKINSVPSQEGTLQDTTAANQVSHPVSSVGQQYITQQPSPQLNPQQVVTVQGSKGNMVSPFEQQFEKFIQSTAKQNKTPQRAAPMSHVCIERISDDFSAAKNKTVTLLDTNRPIKTGIAKPAVFSMSEPPLVTNSAIGTMIHSQNKVPASSTVSSTQVHKMVQLPNSSTGQVPSQRTVSLAQMIGSTHGTIPVSSTVNSTHVHNKAVSLTHFVSGGNVYSNQSIVYTGNKIKAPSQQNLNPSQIVQQNAQQMQYLTQTPNSTYMGQVPNPSGTSFEDTVVIDSSPDSPDSSNGIESSPSSGSKKRSSGESKEKKRGKLHSITQKLYSSLGEKPQQPNINNAVEINRNQSVQVAYSPEVRPLSNESRLPGHIQPQLLVSQEALTARTNTLTHSHNDNSPSEIGASEKGLMKGCSQNGPVMLMPNSQALSSHLSTIPNPSLITNSAATTQTKMVVPKMNNNTVTKIVIPNASVGSSSGLMPTLNPMSNHSNLGSQGYSISSTGGITGGAVTNAIVTSQTNAQLQSNAIAPSRPLSPSNALASIVSIQELVNNNPTLHSNPLLAATNTGVPGVAKEALVARGGGQIRASLQQQQFRVSANSNVAAAAQFVKAMPQGKMTSQLIRPPFKGHVMPNRINANFVARHKANPWVAKPVKQFKVKNKVRYALPQVQANAANNVDNSQRDQQSPVYVGVNVINCAYIQPQDGTNSNQGNTMDTATESNYVTATQANMDTDHQGSITTAQQQMLIQQEASLPGQPVIDTSGVKQVSAVKPCYRQPQPTHVARPADTNDLPLDFSMKKRS